ncbi:MAG: cytochrome c peroxidase [Polyangiales bacterium]
MIKTRLRRRALTLTALLGLAALSSHCASEQEEEPALTPADLGGQDPETVRLRASSMFGSLPAVMQSSKHTMSEAKVKLGRQLFYETRLSKNQDLSCNTCHDLLGFGVDMRTGSERVSLGHRNQRGTRNGPTVYNAASHFAQFWDGRAIDVEEQAKAPILNAVEMAMPSEAAAVTVIKSIPGYLPLFQAAFPGGRDPITYTNIGIAIGAFERKLVTKDRFDRYITGETDALKPSEVRGLYVFMRAGCPSCHNGASFGGSSYQKLGAIKTFSTSDTGRYAVTKLESDRYYFKVPSLRNVAETGPYFHDGSQATLADAVRTMSEYQTISGKLDDEEIAAVVAFLGALTGELPMDYIVEPAKLAGSSTTPAPNPN